MTTRSFVVFQDEPLPSAKPRTSRRSASEPPSFSAEALAAASALSWLSAQEKENLHPVTGTRAGATADSQTKKRKNSVLATKLHIPPATKKQKELKPDATKKRKALSSTSKTKTTTRKDGKTSAPSRSALVRKVTELPKVEEEATDIEDEGRENGTVAQARADSKCYDLTVSPLADVSKAFDQAPHPVPSAESNKVLYNRLFSSYRKLIECHQLDNELPILKSTTSPTNARLSPTKGLSTPERKRIYTAFTFSSPSPSSKRFTAAQATGLDIFGDIEFKPT
ncbi:hypothetical protein EVG20_g8090 [Dentipellis fragilis]|uniref:Uncharacterized protein n=1 Tax=Dentipellis fragilis TaxID=205917 RepID=A0A4Y9Y9M2_9AGAM|nr:hypothetical protein EVG20_g8090 [Dentipellis fragilis]